MRQINFLIVSAHKNSKRRWYNVMALSLLRCLLLLASFVVVVGTKSSNDNHNNWISRSGSKDRGGVVLKDVILILSSQQQPTSSSSSQSTTGFRVETSIMGESALIDKETSRVIWEGGTSNTLFESLEPKVKNIMPGGGIDHFKATALSFMLLLALIGHFSNEIKSKLLQQLAKTATSVPGTSSRFPFLSTRFVYTILINTILFLPRFDRWFIVCVYVLYLLESFMSSTRRYLMNVMKTPTELDPYVQNLRLAKPIAVWKVRCYHYETPLLLLPIERIVSFIQRTITNMGQRNYSKSEPTSVKKLIERNDPYKSTQQPLFGTKRITSINQGTYRYKQCYDKTIVAVWKRARSFIGMTNESSDKSVEATSSPQGESSSTMLPNTIITPFSAAPFEKIIVSRTVLLADSKARDDYFQQQDYFVKQHGQSDTYAEFSTHIDVDQFKPRIFAIKTKSSSPLLQLLTTRMCFWIFTIFGLTVPYRRILSSYCDVLRLIVVKETFADADNNKKTIVTKNEFESSSSHPFEVAESFPTTTMKGSNSRSFLENWPFVRSTKP